MDYTTRGYNQQTPTWLWKAWKHGPGDDYDRFDQRLTQLMAVDVLDYYGDELDDDKRDRAADLATEVSFVDVEI